MEYKRYGIKVSLAIGGWNDSAGDKYSKLVNDPAARARFITHVVNFLQKYGFDGLDLDWEYPKCWQVRFFCDNLKYWFLNYLRQGLSLKRKTRKLNCQKKKNNEKCFEC